MLALRLILKDKHGKQHCLPFVGSNLGVEISLKRGNRKGFEEKIHAKAIVKVSREEHPLPIGCKVPPPFNSLFDSLR